MQRLQGDPQAFRDIGRPVTSTHHKIQPLTKQNATQTITVKTHDCHLSNISTGKFDIVANAQKNFHLQTETPVKSAP